MTNISKAERQSWIGASEVACIFGESSFATHYHLWHQKAGTQEAEAPDLDDVERVQAGQFMEPAIAAWAAVKFDMPLRRVNRYIPHSTIKQFGASLDYETIKGHIPVEIKNVDYLVFLDNYEVEGDQITYTCPRVTLQLQAQLACTGKPYGYLVVCVGGNQLYIRKVEAHAGAIARIEAGVSDFWQSVHEGKEPSPDYVQDADLIAKMHKAGGGKPYDARGNNHLEQLAADYITAGEDEKDAKNRKKAVKSEILLTVGDADKVILNGATISLTETKPSEIKAYTRAGFRNFRVTAKKEKKAA